MTTMPVAASGSGIIVKTFNQLSAVQMSTLVCQIYHARCIAGISLELCVTPEQTQTVVSSSVAFSPLPIYVSYFSVLVQCLKFQL